MKRYLSLILILLILLAVGASVVFAGSASVSGTLTPGGPTGSAVAQISTPNCTGSTVAFTVLYAAYSFTVDTSGAYTVTESGTESAIYVYQGSFDPNSPATNCIAASNTNPHSLPVNLTAGTQYYVAVIEDSFAQDGMSYSITISGPGEVALGNAVCTYPLPAGSLVYSVPGGAPTFWAADLGTQNTWNLPAGTWYISEFSGDFAKVWMTCQGSPFWIPANAVSR